MVGAGSDPTKFSYGVLRVLHETGYDMVPVNPTEAAESRHEPMPQDRAVPLVLEAPV